jgi:hypothetical protein
MVLNCNCSVAFSISEYPVNEIFKAVGVVLLYGLLQHSEFKVWLSK